MDYKNDPGGRFASDVHRRTLAHLSHPDDDYGWSEPALFERMRPDVGTNLQSLEEMQDVLADLESDGHARRHPGNVWQMTEDGFTVLNGPMANEPSPEDAARGPVTPATIGMAGATSLSPTPIAEGNNS